MAQLVNPTHPHSAHSAPSAVFQARSSSIFARTGGTLDGGQQMAETTMYSIDLHSGKTGETTSII